MLSDVPCHHQLLEDLESGIARVVRPTTSREQRRHAVYERAAFKPSHARKSITTKAAQFGQNGIMNAPDGVVTAIGQPSTARATCSAAITRKIVAATSE